LKNIVKGKRYSDVLGCAVIFQDRINDFRPEDAKLVLKVLNYGTVVVQNNKLQEDGSWKTILVVKFIPFENMTLNEYSKFQTNGVHKDCAGKIYML
jgi:hypothetical protein